MDHILFAITFFWLGQLTLADDGSFNAATNSIYGCGIRKRFGVQLILKGQVAELGQWPWHVGLYYGEAYQCGGTLIDQRHVLTAAHCVTEYEGGKKKSKTQRRGKVAIDAGRVRIHLGQQIIGEFSEHVQIKNVSEVHVHPEFSTNRNDIALLVLSEVVQLSELVIPICLVSGVAKVEDMIDKRGSVVGWGLTENGSISNVLKTAQMPVVNTTTCVQNDPILFGKFMSPNMFCASDINGTSVCQGDSGGGMYLLAGDRWELRGITSFAGSTGEKGCDAHRYVVFTNVASFYEWIKKLTGGHVSKEDMVPKRISELKCLEYRKFARKQNNGVCLNARSPHTVAIIDRNQRHISSGSIISEKFVLTKAPNLMDIFELDVDWDELKVRVGNLPDKDILREFSHPEYDSETYRHHIMLLELKEPLVFTSGLLPACLANEATENVYDILLLNGYTGQNSVNSTVNDYYERNDNKVITNQKCNSSALAAHWKYPIYDEEFCTIFQTEVPFGWSGIVGGPLQTVNTRSCMYTIVGITKLLFLPTNENSFEYTNAFSRVKRYVDWIEEVVWGNEVMEEESFEGSGEAPTIEQETTSNRDVIQSSDENQGQWRQLESLH